MADKTAPKPPTEGTLKAIGELLAASMQKREYEWLTAEELKKLLETGENITVVDCRDAASFAFGHVPGALNVPYRTYMEHAHTVPRGGVVVTACYVGMYGRAAAQKLAKSGHDTVLSLKGGMQAWIDAGYPLDCDEPPIG